MSFQVENNNVELFYVEKTLYSEVRYGITTQVEKSKKKTTVNFMGYDLNKLF